MAPGCANCLDLELCGGLRIAHPVSSCVDLQRFAQNYLSSNAVTKTDPQNIVQRKREVKGWDLNVPCANYLPTPKLPKFVPMIYDRAKRTRPLSYPSVAIPLNKILNKRTGTLRTQSRKDICDKFLIDDKTYIVVSGVHHDSTLEAYWAVGRSQEIALQLCSLDVDLVTTPNFSVFADAERYDNFHNMKRIAICWHELASSGNVTALHVNGRTLRDYERWASFLNEHTEIETIAIEFQTGIASESRAQTHLSWLARLAERTRRPIGVISFGGLNSLPQLAKCFSAVSHVSSDPYLRASNYRKLVNVDTDNLRLRGVKTNMGHDELLLFNVDARAKMVSQLMRKTA